MAPIRTDPDATERISDLFSHRHVSRRAAPFSTSLRKFGLVALLLLSAGRGWPCFGAAAPAAEKTDIARATGAAQINSNPSGLTFVLTGYEITQRGTTPTKLEKLPAGNYTLTISRTGWPEHLETLTIKRDETATALVEFIGGAIEITSTPSGAEVFLETQRLGVTPLTQNDAAPGRYDLTLKLKDHKDAKVSVDVIAKQAAHQAVTLERLPKTPPQNPTGSAPSDSGKAASAEPTTPAVGAGKSGLSAEEKRRIENRRAAVSERAKREGAWAVLDRSAQTLISVPLVLYASSELVVDDDYVLLKPGVALLATDMAKLYDDDPETLQFNAKIHGADQRAQDEVDRMNKEGNALVAEYKTESEKASNPALVADARQRAAAAAEAKLKAIRQKQDEVRVFIENVRAMLQQRLLAFRNEKLKNLIRREVDRVTAVARGPIVLLESAGPSLFGISPIIYRDPGFGMDEKTVPRPESGPAIKLLVVDIAKLYDNHYKTIEQNARLQADEQKAQSAIESANKERVALEAEYAALNERANDSALTAEARARLQADAQTKLIASQAKKTEADNLATNSRNSLQQRLQTFKSLLLEEVGKSATAVAKRKGATLVLDKTAPSLNLDLLPFVVTADAALNATDEVMAEINRDRPAAAPAISVPGVKPK